MGTRVIQVFPFQIHLATVLLRQAAGRIEWGRASYVVTQQLVELFLEVLALYYVEISILQLFYTLVEDFRYISTSKFSVIAILIN